MYYDLDIQDRTTIHHILKVSEEGLTQLDWPYLVGNAVESAQCWNNICEPTRLVCVCLWGGSDVPLRLPITVVNEAQTGQNWFNAGPANDHFLALNLISWWGAAALAL